MQECDWCRLTNRIMHRERKQQMAEQKIKVKPGYYWAKYYRWALPEIVRVTNIDIVHIVGIKQDYILQDFEFIKRIEDIS